MNGSSAETGIVPAGGNAAPTVRRKRIRVDQRKLDRAMQLLGISSEALVIDRALDALLMDEEIIAGLRRLAGRGYEIENLFDPHLNL